MKLNLNFTLRKILAITLFLFSVFLYLNTSRYGYVYDDSSIITDNKIVKKGIEGIPDIFSKSYRHGFDKSYNKLYRPLSQFMFAVEWEIWPNNPLPGHLINILLFGLTSVLLFYTLMSIWGKDHQFLVFLTVLLFAAHPIHTEVVANIKSRDEILSFIFSVLALKLFWNYTQNKKYIYLISALISFLMAMFSKEGSASFLFVISIVLFYFYEGKDKKRMLIQSSLFLIPFAIYFAARYQVLSGFEVNDHSVQIIDNSLVGAPFIERWATAFVFLEIYLYQLVLPIELVHDMSYNQVPLVVLTDYRSWLSLILYLGILVGSILSFKKNKILSFSLLYFLITLGLYSNLLIMIGTNYAERILYFSSLGFTIFLSSVLVYIFKIRKQSYNNFLTLIKQNRNLLIVILFVVSLYSFKTIDRNKDWESSYTLFSADVLKSPESAHLRFNYGVEVMKEKGLKSSNPMDAINFYNVALENIGFALEMYPDYHSAFEQTGLVHYRMGNEYKKLLQQSQPNGNKENMMDFEQKLVFHYTKAKEYYETSVEKKETDIAYQNLGAICFDFGLLDLALKYTLKSLELAPKNANSFFNLGSIYGTKKEYNKAIDSFNKALKYGYKNPESVHLFLAQTYRFINDEVNAGRHEQMAQMYQKK